ncbi:hypothetical protein [Winogradskyella sp. 3972H.M.0a.05]|uniref:hypothetical protein n=1 Tax=Winogradskyella sp. 3972H.M.0a.05 TaxID=2950277 RepID=UPI0033928066
MRRAENLENFLYNQTTEESLANYFGLKYLHTNGHIVRNEKGWRDNELEIDYIWIAKINLSFKEPLGLITIKYNKSSFRDIHNPEKLSQAIFLFNENGSIKDIYSEELISTTNDPIWNMKNLSLADDNRSITLDGVSYNYCIITQNVKTQIIANNPNSSEWKKWEKEIWDLGKKLAASSGKEKIINLFK